MYVGDAAVTPSPGSGLVSRFAAAVAAPAAATARLVMAAVTAALGGRARARPDGCTVATRGIVMSRHMKKIKLRQHLIKYRYPDGKGVPLMYPHE